MIDELLPAELPEAVRAVVVDRAEGNPFFVEELVRTLIDQGVLERRNGGWTVRELAGDFVVPDTCRPSSPPGSTCSLRPTRRAFRRRR